MKILDHGYLKLVETWGSDQAVIEAARMSTDKGFRCWDAYQECRKCLTWHRGGSSVSQYCLDGDPHDWRNVPKGDAGLLRYMWEHEHSTPFEFGGLTIEVQAPIAVFREWHRHRVPFGYSELSARYTPMPDLNYVPTIERCMLGGGHLTKQAAAATGSAVLTETQAGIWLDRLQNLYDHAQKVYEGGLEVGIPKELARGAVTVFRYSRMRATGNLRGWLNFCRLRMAPTAQWEIRQYADAVGKLLQERFPRSWALFEEPTPKERRIRELETAIREIRSLSVTVGYDSGHTGIAEICERLLAGT